MRRDESVPAEQYIRREWGFQDGTDADTLALASLIARWSQSGNWLDLGCGPMLAVWPMFSPHPVLAHGIDRNPELADFYTRLRASGEASAEHLGPARLYAERFRTQRQMELSRNSPVDVVSTVRISSVLEPVGEWASRFQTVIQVGCFGCLNSLAQLTHAMRMVHDYLAMDGVFLSATWLPRQEYFESWTWGGDHLRDLTCESFEDCLREAGLSVLFRESTALDNKNYRERFMVVARRCATLA
jgi:hypothetical protein